MSHVYHLIALLCLLPQVLAKNGKILTLTSDNWKNTLEGEWMIKFYAPWCPACRSMADDYKMFADWSDDLNIQVAEVDVNEETGLSGRFIVTALPTIYHGKDGQFRRYSGQRDTNSLHRYVEDKLWRGTDPVAWYRHPDSIPREMDDITSMDKKHELHISVTPPQRPELQKLFYGGFDMAMVFHETLTEKFGYSSTTSYIIFGVATVITGLVLGLVLVVVIECVAPQKKKDQEQPALNQSQASQNVENDSVEDHSESSQESCSGSDEGSKDGSSASEDEAPTSQRAVESSSQISQEWEKVIGDDDSFEAIQNADEKSHEKEEGQGELRRRKTDKLSADEELW